MSMPDRFDSTRSARHLARAIVVIVAMQVPALVCAKPAAQPASARPAVLKVATRQPDAVQQANAITSADDAFLAARDAYRSNDPARGAVFAQRVLALDPHYPLTNYLEYWALARPLADYGNALAETAPDDVAPFIARHPGSLVGDLARRDWLIALGKRGEWSTFEAELPKLAPTDDGQIHCFHLTARALREIRGVGDAATPGTPEGPRATASADLVRSARAVIAQPRDFASDTGACATLARVLVAERRIAPAEVWGWMRNASDNNQLTAVRRYALLFTDPERGGDSTRFFKQLDVVLDKPALWLAKTNVGDGGAGPSSRWQRELAVLALARIARTDPAMGESSLQRLPPAQLTPADVAYLYAQLAATAAKKQMPEANAWSRKSLEATNLTEDILGWQVRGALRVEDWPLVAALIEKMPTEMRRAQANDGTWAYWLGRAYKAQKKVDAAQAQFRQVADQFGFYGQLATEEIGQMITLPARAQAVTEAEVSDAKAQAGIARAIYFYRLDLRREGNLEWNFAVRGMTDRELLAAAEWAYRNQLFDRAVNTADRTKNEHDFAFRFLMPFRPQMQEKATAAGLDIDWVYGLIRQESRFLMAARSSVGASGLMQLMPSTARYVAKRIGMDAYRADGVTDIDTNLTLGTTYLRMVLDDLDNLPVLATAAYNAGPGRPRAWRATLTRPVEGAIFAETIPFPETRDYVKKVMSNATYYAVLISGSPQSLKNRMGFIAQRGLSTTELPQALNNPSSAP
jgi:soluble lytic murein transglycosylase